MNRLGLVFVTLCLIGLGFAAGAGSKQPPHGVDVAPAPASPTTPHHVRLTWTETPQSRATVSWSTKAAGSAHRLYLDTEPRGGALESYRHQIPTAVDGRYSGDPAIELHYHHVRLDELMPATRYHAVVASDTDVSEEFWFVTAPADDRTFSILNGGDSRSDAEMRRRMNRRIAALFETHPDTLCFTHSGDYIYDGTVLAQWREWLDDHQLTTTESGRLVPVVPTRGNHESLGPLYDEVFDTPGGGLGENWFATTLSAEVLLITLNTEVPAGGPQTEFLRDAVERHQDAQWRVAQYHRPIFPAVKEPARAKPHWQPLFEEYRFDLVCEGDGHTLRRTLPIRGDGPDEDGVVYIGEGGLGVPQRTPDTTRWYLQAPGMAASAHHVWRIEFTDERVRARAHGLEGEILDSFERAPRRALAPRER